MYFTLSYHTSIISPIRPIKRTHHHRHQIARPVFVDIYLAPFINVAVIKLALLDAAATRGVGGCNNVVMAVVVVVVALVVVVVMVAEEVEAVAVVKWRR